MDTRRKRTRRRVSRKDRLIQTRVAEDLEQKLKREAEKRRLTVSHLIRNTLEDAFVLVEDVTSDVEQLVTGSVELAAAVGRDARRLASIVRGRKQEEGATPGPEPEMEENGVAPQEESASEQKRDLSGLGHVYGWNRVVANRGALCAGCEEPIERGDDALVGLSDDPTKPRAWLCGECAEELAQ